MKNLFISLLILPTSLFAIEIKFDQEKNQIYTPGQCELNDTCDLEKFKLTTQDYKVKAGGVWRHGSRAFISFQTKTTNDLRKFGVVQFIKGCVYRSQKDQNNKVVKNLNISREFYGGYSIFNHPEWVIDSIDEDPLYNSYNTEIDRFGAYRWSPTPGIFTDYDSQVYLLEKEPSFPEIYVTDRPAQAYYADGVAKNISLNFKTCLYKTNDIPQVSIPTDTNFATPVTCFEWNSHFNFDHDKKVFKTENVMADICK